MRKTKTPERIRELNDWLRTKLWQPSVGLLKWKTEASGEKSGLELGRTGSLAYQLVGERTKRILPLFKDLDQNLQRSGLRVNFKAYVSLTIFAAILIAFVALVLISSLSLLVFNVPPFSAVLFGAGASLFTFASSIIGFYLYPIYRADKHKRELDDELPFATGYMAILASAGVSPEKIFYSISNMSVPLAVSQEAKNIVRNVNLFGLDIISALETASKQTPSERLRETLQGIISAISSGSNLAAYLREKSKQNMKLKRISLKKFADNLSILSEVYVALLLTGPLLLIIMLAVIAMLGGGGLGILSPDLLLNLLTYVGVPVSAIIFLIVLDATSPKW
ncbi:MAG: type II secretion system F family protein [Candidatus Bathycorpusculaceae bacterium]